VREGRAIPAAESVHTSEGAAAILRPLFAGLDREQFLICGLDAKHKLIGINVVSTGSLNLTIVHPREVFKPLILMNAGACVLTKSLFGNFGERKKRPVSSRNLTGRLSDTGEQEFRMQTFIFSCGDSTLDGIQANLRSARRRTAENRFMNLDSCPS
jgi:DNA repair protein RadC